MSYMGIDIGTTGCKALVFDGNGKQISSAYREYPVIMPRPGWAELDSAKVIENCFAAIREAAGNSIDKVRAIGISSQGEAFTPLDKDGRILGNAMVSFDTRASEMIKACTEKFGKKKLYDITGHTAHPMFTLFKLLWLRKNNAEVFNQTYKFLCFEDLLQFKLGLDPAMGWPLAGRTMLFDIKKHCWSADILELCGISPAQLARPLKSGTVSGKIPANIARALALNDDVIVVSGGHDQPCGALGAGVIKEGCAMYATGTVECICPAFSSPVLSDGLFKSNLCTYDFTLDKIYTTVAFSLTGGNILKWFRDEFAQPEISEAERLGINPYELLLGNMSRTPTSLMVLPHFTPTGTPYFDTEAAGAILGLKLSTKKSELVRALLEGVAFEMRLNLDILNESGIRIDELRAIGGGAKSPVWTQLKADVLNKPISTLQITEAGCLGVAMLAYSAHSGENIAPIVAAWVKPGDTVNPNPEFAASYTEKFELYKKLYPAVKKLRQ